MTASLSLLVLMAVLFGSGIYVMLERSLTRVLIGFLLVGNAVNILIYLMSGAPGLAPLLHEGVSEDEISDPVPQAFILTAIVINLGITAFMLALIYRSWWLAQLGDKGDLIDDEDEDIEDAEEAEELVRTSHEDDEAIQSLIDASDEEFDDEFDDDFDSLEAEIDREPEDASVTREHRSDADAGSGRHRDEGHRDDEGRDS